MMSLGVILAEAAPVLLDNNTTSSEVSFVMISEAREVENLLPNAGNVIWDTAYDNVAYVKKKLSFTWPLSGSSPDGCTIRIKNTGNTAFQATISSTNTIGGTNAINSDTISPGVTRAFYIDSAYFNIASISNNYVNAYIYVYCASTSIPPNSISMTGYASYS